ncbi:hypothetical protein TanjilG_11367 [Lupinus angustifolius]|uniref:Terpene synthase N-terminal domain-containing protein n=1 Tax=Lupinus angustifolius TaxID=3871 RepID=A0A1J7I5A1_LUPAN|nr:hypothetical protein TanjilG_11367 [Lupinus angustifolius]
MSSNIMSIRLLRVSLPAATFPCRSSWPFMAPPWNLSLQTSKLRVIHSKLSIMSVALHHQLVPIEAECSTKSLEQVKRKIQETLLNSDRLGTLKIIDSIQHLGIGHHFEEEINALLGRVLDYDTAHDLFATSLHFRLLRHNGFPTSSDIFKKFCDKSGYFKESLSKDIWGMLSLYEASYLGAEGEELLHKAMDFSKVHLHNSISQLGPQVSMHIARSLILPRHLKMAKLEAKNYIHEYSHASNQIPALLELAKLDYDMAQSLHQRELAEICRQATLLLWWKELGLVGRLGFGRDRPAECFLWTLGIFPEPSYSNCRIELTKTICILLVMDDIFDTYGSLDDLILFTDAIRRIQKEHGVTVVAHLKRTWIDIFEAFLEEAKWFNKGYMPTFREYLNNGVISAGSYMAMVHATFLIGDGNSKENISMMKPYPRLFSCSGEILRLWDDLGTSTEEQERGDNACSIQCHMRENNISDENEARKHIREFIGKLWQELNGIAMNTNLPWSIVKASLNMARTAQVIYQHGDDKSTYSVDEYVQTLLFTPSPRNS